MGIHQLTPENQISQYLEEELRKREQVIINVLNRVGMACLNEARNNGSYIDQTGNLRSSIGYAILRDGNISTQSNFQQVKGGSAGKASGNGFVQELASKYNRGIVLIVVAGMNYAAYVETKRNVLSSSELLASRLVPSLLGQLGFSRG
jgi:hypothetical protein